MRRKSTPVCQADGCGVLLGGGVRVYNRRCGICSKHQKAPLVTLNGVPHRFCHQCAKLQPASCFKVRCHGALGDMRLGLPAARGGDDA
jgi:hypothetical protein